MRFTRNVIKVSAVFDHAKTSDWMRPLFSLMPEHKVNDFPPLVYRPRHITQISHNLDELCHRVNDVSSK